VSAIAVSASSGASVRLVVDSHPVEIQAGATVLEAVHSLGLPLPQLCKDPERAPLGACRTCLVHVEGVRGLPAACHLPVSTWSAQ
jgi:formate dehydrogenase major subunit